MGLLLCVSEVGTLTSRYFCLAHMGYWLLELSRHVVRKYQSPCVERLELALEPSQAANTLHGVETALCDFMPHSSGYP